MSKDLKKKSEDMFFHLITIFYDLRMKTTMNQREDEMKTLCFDEKFMSDVFKECVKKAKSYLPKVVRQETGAEGVSVKHVDLERMNIKLKMHHKEMCEKKTYYK
jgi:S-adenosylmethionine/arginine decarboxylase-like enzyme